MGGPTEQPFWSRGAEEVLAELESSPLGLSRTAAATALQRRGSNRLGGASHAGDFGLLAAQFTSPIVLLLLGAAVLSAFLGDASDAIIIIAIVVLSALLSWWQERGAAGAVKKLLALVQVPVVALRDGAETEIALEDVVPGDVTILRAGSRVPADGLLLESHDLFVDEAALTGETYPVEKLVGVGAAGAPIAQRHNALFAGTHVVSGTAHMLVVHTGQATEFGHIAERLRLRPPETDFERGVRRFGYLIMEVTFVLLVLVFGVNVYFHRPVLEAFLFSLALAVGLTPQMLPAIISVNLAHGARRMAEGRVIVRRLSSIENFGSMDVLCSDKTGTLTEGAVKLEAALDPQGRASEAVLFHAWLNASSETGFVNPIDEAVRAAGKFTMDGWEKRDEVPYDFLRKRLSILVAKGGEHRLITKGALSAVLDVCTRAQAGDGVVHDLDGLRPAILASFEEFSGRGCRTLGVAVRDLGGRERISRDDEAGMTFLGFLLFSDPPKQGIAQTVAELRQVGIAVKMITGDNGLVASRVAKDVGLERVELLTGREMRDMSETALCRRAVDVDVFAEIEPNQKERIILALKKAGRVVGFVGDGINDASALHAADVGISVDSAVDVAKEAADLVLLEHDLEILLRGVREGRTTFVNTLKYVHMATSANFGNMFSMAGASLLLPFLPLLPKQILLTNLLTDLPAMSISTDAVDQEQVETPRRWDIGAIRRFMFVFGLVSSIFDYLTFAVLLLFLHADERQFRTGWFVESVVSASMIVLVIRSRRPFFRSMPSATLTAATAGIVVVAALLPYSPLASVLQFERLPWDFLLFLAGILVLYVSVAEVAKYFFWRFEDAAARNGRRRGRRRRRARRHAVP